MKITGMESFFVAPRWHFLKVTTDEGIVGWGEPIVESRARTVAEACRELGRLIIGQDPLRIEYLYNLMYKNSFYRGGPVLSSAISGIEQALWDIKGKYYNMPVYEMLGGRVRDKIRMYAHAGGATVEEYAAAVKDRADKGFTAIKSSFGEKEIVSVFRSHAYYDMCAARMEAARKVAPQVEIAIDLHGQHNPYASIQVIEAIAKYHPMFVEEPATPENMSIIADIAKKTGVPIAAGERLFTRFGFREAFELHAIAVAQPDLCHCGGILEAKKIAAMAETYFIQVAPHNPLGPISLAACLQVDACTQNFLCQEHPTHPEKWDLGEGYLKKPFVIENGYIAVPDGPGLGIEVDEDVVRERQNEGTWDSPVWTLTDGTPAEW